VKEIDKTAVSVPHTIYKPTDRLPVNVWVKRDEYTKEEQREIMREGKLFYNYRHYLPSGETCYIGMGTKNRMVKSNKGLRCRIGINELKSEIFWASEDSDLVTENEILAIRSLGRKEFGGILENKAEGGHGGTGRIASEEESEKRRISSTGRVLSKEARRKISESRIGHTWNLGRKNSRNTSGYVGVSACKLSKRSPWQSYINVKGKRIPLGSFSTPELAAKAYNDHATFYFGPSARLNTIPAPTSEA
jgi:NUMOD3 motif